MSDENEDVGTRYYGTDIDDPLIYGYGDSGYGFDSDAFYDFGYGDYDPSYDFWTTIGIDPNTTMENWESPSNAEIESAIQGDPSWLTFAKKYGDKALSMLKNKDGKYDLAKIASLGIGAYSLAKGKDDSGGYNKPVPKMDVVAERPVYDDTNRRPGEAGRRYFTNPLFVAQGDTENMQKAYDATMQQKAALEAAAPQYAAPAPNPYAGTIPLGFNPPEYTTFPATSAQEPVDMKNQQGGIKMAQGGIADAGRYLRGKTDGMADEIETSIDEEQPALLSHGEFVIPADVVSHLGNGNSEAGAEKLYEMMDRIRMARTGTKEQGKEINPDKFLAAAGGGLAATYAGGGQVQRFNGVTGSDVNATGGNAAAPTTTGAGGIPKDVSRTSTLSPWVGDYVTNALGQGAALANAPYQAYQGPLTAGASNLQQQAFAGASDLASAGYMPSGTPQYSNITAGNVSSTFAQPASYDTGTFTNQYTAPESYEAGQFGAKFEEPTPYATGQFTNSFNAPTSYATGQFTNTYNAPKEYQGREFSLQDFGADQVQKYVNPYIQYAIEPQLREMQRQADIQRTADAGRLTQAGAFGGSRQAIMEAEGRRNLLNKQSDVLGAGYASAYDKALAQYNTSQAAGLEAQRASEASRQFGANQSMTAAQLQAQYGMTAQQAQEASRQFGAGQALTAAQLQAQYGLSAQQAQEASRQFGSSQGLTAADLASKYRLSEQQAQEASRQFGATQGMTAAQLMAQYGMSAQQAQEASRQFGATTGLAGATTAGQQSLEAQRANQMSGLEAARANQAAALEAAQAAEASRQFGAGYGLKTVDQLADLGAIERGITSEGLAADKAQFEEERNFAYKMPQYQLGLLSGLPIGSNTTAVNQDAISKLQSDVGGLTSLYQMLANLGQTKKD